MLSLLFKEVYPKAFFRQEIHNITVVICLLKLAHVRRTRLLRGSSVMVLFSSMLLNYKNGLIDLS